MSTAVSAELGGQEPWPQDVKLFKPFAVEQILLPDSALCLSVSTFLRMCKLEYEEEERANAEFMSPTGRVPFIKAGAFVIAELDQIITFVNHKNVSLTSHLDSTQKADMRAYISLVNNVLGSAQLYMSWVDSETYNEVTFPRYSSVHPWPLNYILTKQKRNAVLRRLDLLGWKKKTCAEVYEEVDNCCKALDQRLDNQTFFFGNSPTELDAVVFGHLFTLFTTPLPSNTLKEVVGHYPALVQLCTKIESDYYENGVLSRKNPVHSESSEDPNGEYDKLDDFVATAS